MGKTYGTRPSDVLGVEDPWAAYQLDMACMTFGSWVEAKLDQHDKKGRPKYRLEDLLRQPAPDGKRQRPTLRPASAFQSPMLSGMPIQAVEPKPDGTW